MSDRRGSHPHLSPLPSRERMGSTLTPYQVRGRLSVLSRPTGGGVTLTSVLSRRGRGWGAPSPRIKYGAGSQSSLDRQEGESPSPQSSPVEGEDGEHPHLSPLPSDRMGSHPHLSPLPSRERRGSTLTPYQVRGRLSVLSRPTGGGVTLTPTLSLRERGAAGGRGGQR